jgi:hypothetical protein
MSAAALAIAVAGLVLGPAAPAPASTYYDYWGYWHKPPAGNGGWQYSKVGPSGYYLQPGTQVEGWRYAVGTASASDPQPRPSSVTYDEYCAGHDTGATYRVLLVVDYGTQSGAPSGPVYSCYGFAGDAPSGLAVLTKQHTERDSGGLICAIDTYPKTGCGDVVSSPAPKPARSPAPTSTGRSTAPAATTGATRPAASARSTSATTATSAASRPAATKPAHASSATPSPTDAATTPAPSESTSVVAKQFVPPRNRGGIPVGFVAGCVFVVALVAAVAWQRRRRAG